MTKFLDLPKNILKKIVEVEKKIVTYPVDDKLKRFKQKYEDKKANRELIVVDKYGNRYYQYYSHHGLPTRRYVALNMISFNKWKSDPVMLSWLRDSNRAITQEELEKMYIEQEEFQRKALEWDKKENEMIEEYNKRKRAAIEQEQSDTFAIGEGEAFQPGIWDKSQPMRLDEVETDVEVKNLSNLPGKYYIDINEDNERYIEERAQKALEPYVKAWEVTDWSQYTFEKMNQRWQIKHEKEQEERKENFKKITNLGKKMLEKKETYKRYAEFNKRYSDVFENFNEILNKNKF